MEEPPPVSPQAMLLALFWLVTGLVLLVAGAEALVRGATRLSAAAGLSRLVIGLVVVSLGTSAPEIAISTGSALAGNADLAVGNVLGSNVFNVLFILGATALIAPLIVQRRLVRLDIPIMAGAGFLFGGLALDGELSRLDGVVLAAAAAGFLGLNLYLGRREAAPPAPEGMPETFAARRHERAVGVLGGLLFAGIGLVGLVIGARLAVAGAVSIAEDLGASDLVIGLTIVAAGTGMPEAVTSILAAVRGERDIAIGNIVGSNVLNVTAVLGIAALVSPDALSVARGAITFDLPVMLVVSIALLPIAFTGQLINRWEGALFLVYYVAYVTHLVLTATVHPVTDEFAFAFGGFAMPITAIVLVAAVVQEWKRRTHRRRTPRGA